MHLFWVNSGVFKIFKVSVIGTFLFDFRFKFANIKQARLRACFIINYDTINQKGNKCGRKTSKKDRRQKSVANPND